VEPLNVWVLAGSTGGIEAVSRFLSLVPRRQDVGFVYVQHLYLQQHPQLLRVVERHGDWPARGVDYGASLKGGWVTVPSADERFDIDEDGVMGVVSGEGWKPPYRPNIDEVAFAIARRYRHKSGLIVFSGMGQDGCGGADAIVGEGGALWVQAPQTCAAVSMPQQVLARHPMAFAGTLEDLAEKFNGQF
jgi:chemosensory pili system protein ChpB (putative protein-glutamate methylesterase)